MKAIASAVTEAKQELRYVASEIVALTTKQKQLEAFIKSGELLAKKSLRPQTSWSDDSFSDRAKGLQQLTPTDNGAQREVWKNIADALRKTARPMRPKEVVEAMARLGTPVSGNFPRDHVRTTMSRRTSTFERVGPGYFGLKEWPPEMKQLKLSRLQ
jgi:hypothetical protein